MGQRAGVLLTTVLLLLISRAFGQPNITAWEVLKRDLSDDNPDKRKQAVTAVGTIGPAPEVIQVLNQALRDKEIIVRQTAAAEIGDAKIRQCIPNLQAALDDTPEVAFTAAKALWDMDDRSGRWIFEAALTRQLQEGPGLLQGAIRDAKKKLRSPTALAKMGINEASGALLGPFSMGITAVQEAMKDTGAPSRALSAQLLSQACDARGVQLLEWALETDGNDLVKAACAKALGACGNSASIAKLMPLLTDGNVAVRDMAAAAIVKLSIEKLPPKPPRVRGRK
jgi:HEAT repeat protein